MGMLKQIQSLGYGGLLGSGLLGLIYLIWPNLFPAHIAFENVLAVGGLLGAGLHKTIGKFVERHILKPLMSYIHFRMKMEQYLKYRSIMSDETRLKMLQKIVVDYLLGPNSKNSSLPPPED